MQSAPQTNSALVSSNPGTCDNTAFHDSAIHLLLGVFASIDTNLKRIADKLNPPDDDKPVGTPYVAKRLGQTTTWVAEMCRNGVIPKSCVLAGTGVGKPWKFHRQQIDNWIETR
jgi:Helix-turn-helix domain